MLGSTLGNPYLIFPSIRVANRSDWNLEGAQYRFALFGGGASDAIVSILSVLCSLLHHDVLEN
jgi:hypothetical protein